MWALSIIGQIDHWSDCAAPLYLVTCWNGMDSVTHRCAYLQVLPTRAQQAGFSFKYTDIGVALRSML